MLKVIISQRRDPVQNRVEIRDAIDVGLPRIIYGLGFLPVPLCSDLYNSEDYIEALSPDAILISGGNDIGSQPKRDMLDNRLLNYAKANNIPVLGICRGAQMMNHYLGGSLKPIKGHVSTRQQLYGDWVDKHGYTNVNSYHKFAITKETISEALDILAVSGDGVVKALQHKTLPWLGIMWHPEREQTFDPLDLKLIASVLQGSIHV
jgi:gamma-glutamyl-gamma-aminobutyrate hydrolase PuuD